jgi:prepilin-type N-terminal cleavage/methylation domain-containing protein
MVKLKLTQIKLAQKILQDDRGFGLVEVLVAILVISSFVGVTMQAVVISAISRAKAQQYTESTNWIQQDLEQVKYQADDLDFPQSKLTSDPTIGGNLITISSTVDGGTINDFSVNDTFKIGIDTTTYKITAVSDSTTTRTLTISPALAKPQVTNTEVFSMKKCSATTSTTGLAEALKNKLPASPLEKEIKGKNFTLTRTTEVSSASPYNVLKVNYNVTPTSVITNGISSNSELSIASFYIEVIPNVSFQCQ